MKLGFGKNDITPRIGIELCGFGPYRFRRSTGIRDRLWARAMAVEQDGKRFILISCDLVSTPLAMTQRIRSLITAATGVPADAVLVHATHTHSGPATASYIGWGATDAVYLETLPARIVKAAVQAVAALCDATLSHAEVPCEGVGLNREYDKDSPPLEEVLREDWRPAKPELTDTTCHVLRAEAGGRTIGFLHYFSCHPVTCCTETTLIHGDYCGVANSMLEWEHPGSVGLFLQGALGDVNSCVVHKPAVESYLALDVVAARYARAVRHGLAQVKPIKTDRLSFVRRSVPISRKPWGLDKLRSLRAQSEARVHHPDATDVTANDQYRIAMETVYLVALRQMIAAMEAGDPLAPPAEIHGLRLGPVALLGAPFEIFQAIKRDVLAQAKAPIPLVMSFVNDNLGYAVDRPVAARGGYATDMVPLICASLPFANVHDEVANALIALDGALAG